MSAFLLLLYSIEDWLRIKDDDKNIDKKTVTHLSVSKENGKKKNMIEFSSRIERYFYIPLLKDSQLWKGTSKYSERKAALEFTSERNETTKTVLNSSCIRGVG